MQSDLAFLARGPGGDGARAEQGGREDAEDGEFGTRDGELPDGEVEECGLDGGEDGPEGAGWYC